MPTPVYAYTVVVDRWPDWCPDGWERVYTDCPEGWNPQPKVPDALRSLAIHQGLPYDMPVVYSDVDGEYARIVCPRRDRTHWLSGPAANRWIRHAIALGAEAHVVRGRVVWEVDPTEPLACTCPAAPVDCPACNQDDDAKWCEKCRDAIAGLDE